MRWLESVSVPVDGVERFGNVDGMLTLVGPGLKGLNHAVQIAARIHHSPSPYVRRVSKPLPVA
ncbi:hypothetical protein [Streptomyces sp. Tue6028]|uniref:hypothetical protein n=1 Tax=Streptomyces sp. Tue6028 TaxID=2036037 RepID=UPI003D737511